VANPFVSGNPRMPPVTIIGLFVPDKASPIASIADLYGYFSGT
jgi:hypothetical protein